MYRVMMTIPSNIQICRPPVALQPSLGSVYHYFFVNFTFLFITKGPKLLHMRHQIH
uniref:Uncharacterized protein n=1 Tax=mine drainage metagenome TaxID=410659 RepID=E6QLW3_9ZZZZ